MSTERKLVCSFCGRNEDQVAKLVAGRAGYICNTCAATAHRIMSGPGSDSASAWNRVLRLFARIARLFGQRRSLDPLSVVSRAMPASADEKAIRDLVRQWLLARDASLPVKV